MTPEQIDWHEAEMMRHFEAGRFASARWHCRLWTYAKARQVFNDGIGRPTEHGDIRPPCTPSPYNGELRGE